MSDYESRDAHPGADFDLGSCALCGAAVDPLRAARVRIISDRFHYFCSAQCADEFDPREHRATPISPHAPAQLRSDQPARHVTPVESVAETEQPPAPLALGQSTEAGLEKPSAETRSNEAIPSPEDQQSRLLLLSVLLAALSIALLLAEESLTTRIVRATLVTIGTGTLTASFLTKQRPDDSLPAPRILPLPILSVAVAIIAVALRTPEAGGTLGLAATLLLTYAGLTWVLARLVAPLRAEQTQLEHDLEGTTWHVQDDRVSKVPIADLRPGEQIVIHAGETVMADVTLSAGSAEVYPWLGADTPQPASPGSFIYAGARLASGQIRATIRWNGLDRHWLRLTSDPARRADLHAPAVLLARKTSTRGALIAATLSVVVGIFAEWSRLTLAMNTLVAASIFVHPWVYRVPALHVMAAVLSALKRGIVFKSAQTLEAAGRVSTAVFCARGTLLLGEPELSSIDTLSNLEQDEILSLVAGAEQFGVHPVAVAIQRAARAHNIQADAVRSPHHQPGLGVTAVASHGKALVVGSRGLMLKERISVAKAEARITELEASGRTVILVALDNHLVGLLSLQDGLRAGARAAVQHLLDVGIEPVLLSGDGRETCASLGRTIDIDHLRPDVLPADRGREVERLRSGGANVAVVGRSPTDDIALAAATVSVALPGLGNNNSDFDVELGNDEVQKAALALRIAHDLAKATTRAVLILLLGASLALLCLLALGIPAGWLPIIWLGISMLAALPLLTAPAPANPTP